MLIASFNIDAHIQRIEQVNKDLNAVVIPLFEQARKQVKEADRKQKRGEALGPFHGVPVTIGVCLAMG